MSSSFLCKNLCQLNPFSKMFFSDYSNTLCLSQSPFKIQSKLDEEKKFYLNENVNSYKAQKSKPGTFPLFTLLDGPPFANGSLHIGHALNKILKDIYLRIKILEGHSVR